MSDLDNELYTRQQAAEYIGISVATFANWILSKKINIPFIKEKGRLIKYKKEDLDEFIRQKNAKLEDN